MSKENLSMEERIIILSKQSQEDGIQISEILLNEDQFKDLEQSLGSLIRYITKEDSQHDGIILRGYCSLIKIWRKEI